MNRISLLAICLTAAAAIGSPALAAEGPPLVTAPATSQAPTVSLALSYELKFWLAPSTTLAELLLQSNITAEDATAADKLAAGHESISRGCFVRVAVTKPLGSTDYRLQRLTLITDDGQTVMERRNGAIAIVATGRPAQRRQALT